MRWFIACLSILIFSGWQEGPSIDPEKVILLHTVCDSPEAAIAAYQWQAETKDVQYPWINRHVKGCTYHDLAFVYQRSEMSLHYTDFEFLIIGEMFEFTRKAKQYIPKYWVVRHWARTFTADEA